MFVKICGVRDLDTAVTVIETGADAIGFVHHPASPRHIEADRIRAILDALGSALTGDGTCGVPETVLVVRGQPVEQVLALARTAGVSTVQFHGDEPDADLVRARDEGFEVIRARSLAAQQAAESGPLPGRLLLDAPLPGQGQLIGSAEFEMTGLRVPRPWILAGGLTPDNVAEQIRALHPDGVDVSSGVESARGVKDPELVRRFVSSARAADPT